MNNRLSFQKLRDIAPLILDGDLLLFRRRGLVAVVGRGVHSHAAKAGWWGDRLFCLEIREFHGGRALPLACHVRRFPGRIDVYRANPGNRWPEYDRAGAVRMMKDFVGCRYGYANVLRAAIAHLPILRWTIRPEKEDIEYAMNIPMDDTIYGMPVCHSVAPFCSEACALADRLGGGVDPVPHLADRFSEPADLARSPFYEYQFTLE